MSHLDQTRVRIMWFDTGRSPKVKPNPLYPNGIDLDISKGEPSFNTCKIALPYPAKRIGHYLIVCDVCGLSVDVTTAGRPDDPRSVKVVCKRARS